MLVDYASESDSDSHSTPSSLKRGKKTVPGPKRIIVDLPASPLPEPPLKRVRTTGKSGLSALLPPPKRLAKDAAEKTDSAKSVQAKRPVPSKVDLFPLGELARPKILPSTYESVPDEPLPEPELQTHNNVPAVEPLSEEALKFMYGRRQPSKPADVLNYNLAEAYQSNEEYRATAEETPQPVRAIGAGRHQITQLLHAVHNQRESFEEMFAKNRRAKKEAGKKYGF